jgi:cell division septation protein DedD
MCRPDPKFRRKKIGYYIIIASLVLTAIVITVFVLLSHNKKDTGVSSIVSPGQASPPAATIKQTLPADGKAQIEKLGYSIQVGAWKNPDYAQEMLLKLKKYYAGAYMDKKNNFHFIKIKGISTQQQGAAIAQDINKRFGLKPILIKPDQ